MENKNLYCNYSKKKENFQSKTGLFPEIFQKISLPVKEQAQFLILQCHFSAIIQPADRESFAVPESE